MLKNVTWIQSVGVALIAIIALNSLIPLQDSSVKVVHATKMQISQAHTVSVSQNDTNMRLSAVTVPVPDRKPLLKTAASKNTESNNAGQILKITKVNFSTNFKGFKTGLQNLLPIPQGKSVKEENPLSSVNAAIYRKIFMLQEQGDMEKADEYIAKLTDQRLRGHYLYQRYMHPTAYRSTYEELKDWYVNYSDHPNADRVYKLAMSRKPAGDEGILNLKKVKYEIPAVHEPSIYVPKRHLPKVNRSSAQYSEVRGLSRQVRALVRSGSPTNALSKLNASEASAWMDNVEKDKLKAQIALGYMYAGNTAEAKRISTEAYARSGNKVPTASWVAAMSSWINKDYATAASYFEKTGTSPYASGWQASAGSFWASRAHMRAKNVKQVSKWLKTCRRTQPHILRPSGTPFTRTEFRLQLGRSPVHQRRRTPAFGNSRRQARRCPDRYRSIQTGRRGVAALRFLKQP